MKILKMLFLSILVLGSAVLGQVPNDAVLDSDGNLIVVGEYSPQKSIFVSKYSPDLKVMWGEYYGDGKEDCGKTVAIGPSNEIVVAGYTTDGSWLDWLVIKWDQNGNRKWVKSWSTPGNFVDVAFSAVIDDSGDVYIGGKVGGECCIATIIKLQGDGGGFLWKQSFDNESKYGCINHLLINNGYLYGTGASNGDVLICKLDITTGDSAWVRMWDGMGGNDYGNKVVVDSSAVFVTGTTQTVVSIDNALIVQYSLDGKYQWHKIWPEGCGMDIISDGQNVFVSGHIWNFNNNDVFVVKYDQVGDLLWNYRYIGWGNAPDYAVSSALANNFVAITGYSYGDTSRNIITITVDRGGHKVWSSKIERNSDDYGVKVLYDSLSQFIYTIGHSSRATYSPNICLVKYDLVGKIIASVPPQSLASHVSLCERQLVSLEFNLAQNYPNPFNPETVINYNISQPGLVKLAIYNVLGQKVAELVNEHQTANSYKVTFDASNLTSGIYLYRLEVGGFSKTMKMVLSR